MSHEKAIDLARRFGNSDFNEADTRHQILDVLFHEVLGWPRAFVRVESSVHEGYVDYVFADKSGKTVFVVEAKRQGKYFELPKKFQTVAVPERTRLRRVCTNPNIKDAVLQAIRYCPQVGSEIAIVTNGNTFVIFRALLPGRDFLDGDAVLIPSLQSLSENFTRVYNLLSYNSVEFDRSLHRELMPTLGASRDRFFPKKHIKDYDVPLARNKYAKYLDPISKKYFMDIPQSDLRMMNKCYVFARGTPSVEADLKQRISDHLSPFFQNDGAVEIDNARTGGSLTQRIASSISGSKGEVLILYGGKGAGKSTFLRRVLYHDPPPELKIHAFPVIVDFLQGPTNEAEISPFVWARIVRAMDLDGVLNGSVDDLCRLFEDKYSVSERQDLHGLPKDSLDFNRERNRLISAWKQDAQYVVKRLQVYWKKRGKALVLVFDNTDQLPPNLQDRCFLISQHACNELACISVISMREERYCRARTSGVLDAYHNSGYHLAAPNLPDVFNRRLALLVSDLEDLDSEHIGEVTPRDCPKLELSRFFRNCQRQFRDPDNALRRFIVECSRDNTRLALDFFRHFATSGYTHVDEMIKGPWTVVDHQVIKPMMVPERYNYDENTSMVPNVFQVRSPVNGSHFTSLRILYRLRGDPRTLPESLRYFRVDHLCHEFETRFSMRDDCISCIDTMLQFGLIESNNRLDRYEVKKTAGSKDSIFADEIKITAFGIYMIDFLSKSFTYLELVSLDTGVEEELLLNEIRVLAEQERSLSAVGDREARLSRLESRAKRAKNFVEYLYRREEEEVKVYLLPPEAVLMKGISEEFLLGLKNALESGRRNLSPGGSAAPKESLNSEIRERSVDGISGESATETPEVS